LQATAENCSRESNDKTRIMLFADSDSHSFALTRG